MSKTLNIVNTAYRCTIEEQDDPIVWIAHAMKGAGDDLDVVLRGNAVNYATKGQDASGLSFGGKPQTHPPLMDRDVNDLLSKGAKVYVVSCDARERGIEDDMLIDGIEKVDRKGLAALMSDYARIWSW